MTDKNDISLYAPTQQTHMVRLPKGRDPDKPGTFFPLGGGKGGDIVSSI